MLRNLIGGSRAAPDPKPGPQMCMVALPSTGGLSGARVAAAWRELFPKHPCPEPAEHERGMFSLDLDEASIVLGTMEMPIPAGDIESACAVSWMWPGAAEQMKRQRAHCVIVSAPGERRRGPLLEALAVTRAAAATCRAADAVGVYWGSAGQLHRPDFFVDAARDFAEPDGPPTMLWVGLIVSASSRNGPYTLTTRGLRPFGHKELEIIDTRLGIGDLRMAVFEVITYLLTTGPVFKHGQTFGRSAEEKWTIEHTTSRFRKREPVIRLHIP
jgi:hypothetical protein